MGWQGRTCRLKTELSSRCVISGIHTQLARTYSEVSESATISRLVQHVREGMPFALDKKTFRPPTPALSPKAHEVDLFGGATTGSHESLDKTEDMRRVEGYRGMTFFVKKKKPESFGPQCRDVTLRCPAKFTNPEGIKLREYGYLWESFQDIAHALQCQQFQPLDVHFLPRAVAETTFSKPSSVP